MMVVERLSSKNSDYFNKLIEESKSTHSYKLDFHKYYESNSFLVKYFIKKLVKVFKYNDIYIGYIWIEFPSSQSVKISDIYIKEEYIYLFNTTILSILKSSIVLYEGYENQLFLKTVKNLGMNRIRVTNLMEINPLNIQLISRKTNSSFRLLIKKEDEEIRCKTQNSIFNEDSRTPLSVEDIIYDQKQSYYIEDLCIFILIRNKVIGYGQIIYSRGIYSIVNFGIIEGYRMQGYGRDLLEKLLSLAKEKGIEKLHIRVEHTNTPAKILYTKVGFNEVGNFSTWIWAKDLIH